MVNEEFINECLSDSDGSFGFKFFAFEKVKEYILHRICSPAATPEQVNTPLPQIVKRAILLCKNHLEDVAIFLSQVVVQIRSKMGI